MAVRIVLRNEVLLRLSVMVLGSVVLPWGTAENNALPVKGKSALAYSSAWQKVTRTFTRSWYCLR
jgi:hypothetical protein